MPPIPLLQGLGVELEYAIVDRSTLDIRPAAPYLLQIDGMPVSELARPPLAWSNELVMHVIEIKNPQPCADLRHLAQAYVLEVREINRRLESLGLRLLPTGAHPWMDAHTETQLWQQEQTEIYRAYDRIFGTRGHGWANLQSAHLNLSFGNDREFGLLHSAVRALLPMLPGLAASTPVLDGKLEGSLDARMLVYARNQTRIPSIAGDIVPEPVASIEEYHRTILEPMYEDIRPLDPAGLLQEDWLNSRGAIPKFSRDSMEVRVLDLQERPEFDLVVSMLLVLALKDLTAAMGGSHAVDRDIRSLSQAMLVDAYRSQVRLASAAKVPVALLAALRSTLELPDEGPATAGGFWMQYLQSPGVEHYFCEGGFADLECWYRGFLGRYREFGTCAEMLVARLGGSPRKDDLFREYRRLALDMEVALSGGEKSPNA